MKNKKIIKEVKLYYTDKTYKLGPFVDFIAELEVPSYDYEAIVHKVKEVYQDFENIKIMSFRHG
jgi:hypothetical protein